MEYSLWMLQIRKGKHASIPLAWLTNHHPSRQCFIRYSATQWTRKIGNSFQINTGSGHCLCLLYFVMNFNHGYKCKCKEHIKDTRYDLDENSGMSFSYMASTKIFSKTVLNKWFFNVGGFFRSTHNATGNFHVKTVTLKSILCNISQSFMTW